MAKREVVGCAEGVCASEAYVECFFCGKNLCFSHGGALTLHGREVPICLKDRDRRVGDIFDDPRREKWLDVALEDAYHRGAGDYRRQKK